MSNVPSVPVPQGQASPPLLEMTLGAIGDREIVTIDAGVSIEVARAEMLAHGLSSLVVEERGEPVGMLTRTDLLRAMKPGAKTWGLARDAMTPLIASMPADTPLPEAARQMVDSGIHRVVVTYEGGRLGLASLTDVARALADATALSSGMPVGLQISAMAAAAPPMRELYLASYQRVMVDAPAFFEAFEKRFLARSPFVTVRFEGLPPERVREIVTHSVKAAHGAIVDGRAGLARLNEEGRRHGREKRNIDPKLHEMWADALVSTMRDFDPERDITVEVAWRVMLGHVVRIMSRHY